MSAPSSILIRCADVDLTVERESQRLHAGVAIWFSTAGLTGGLPSLSPSDARALAAALVQQADAVDRSSHRAADPLRPSEAP